LPVHAAASDSRGVNMDQKMADDEGKTGASPRIGDDSFAKDGGSKIAEARLHRQICPEGTCDEADMKTAEADLRHAVCKEGDCGKCASGESEGKDGKCVATAAMPRSQNQCTSNETWNGVACVASTHQCKPNERWDGAACVAGTAQCITIESQAATPANEVRSTKTKMQEECLRAPGGLTCEMLKQSYDMSVTEYRALLGGAPPACSAVLLDPLAL
jgi:hypothetical protein